MQIMLEELFVDLVCTEGKSFFVIRPSTNMAKSNTEDEKAKNQTN